LTLPSPSGNIRFESVDAHPSIDAKESLLRNLDFELTPGTVLAVVGPTGSGKSSLLKAAIGLWPCQKGAVRLDGADIFQWNKTHLGPFIGYLPQEIDLFEGTVASNLARFGDQDASMLHELSEALAMEFVETGLKGMQGLLQDEGANLSAGQRQKLGLARAFYGRPVLIALDEPSSRLDESSERRLMALIRQRSQAGATIIFTTHRMSMLDVADKVLLLSNGSPQWLGARDEFVARLGKP
jgi:ATP-binding cassette subfamily C exporter for protease/lipase